MSISLIVLAWLGRAHPAVRLGRDEPGILVDAPRAVAPRLRRAPHRRLHNPNRVAQAGDGRPLLKLAAVDAVETDPLGVPGPVMQLGGDVKPERCAGPGTAVGVGVGSQRAAAGSARVEPEDPPVLGLPQ